MSDENENARAAVVAWDRECLKAAQGIAIQCITQIVDHPTVRGTNGNANIGALVHVASHVCGVVLGTALLSHPLAREPHLIREVLKIVTSTIQIAIDNADVIAAEMDPEGHGVN